MPEMKFRIGWPDKSESLCYSPSLVVREYFRPGESYTLEDFLARARTALGIASERVRVKYGFACSLALDQLAEIETLAGRFEQIESARVRVIEFV